MSNTSSQTTVEVTREPFPARTRTATANVVSVPTSAMCVSFADKIMITLSQGGRLAHWIHVPLNVSIPEAPPLYANADEDQDLPPSDLLPLPYLTATTILGTRGYDRDTFGQLLATQIASAIKSRNPDEERMVVFGFGFERRTEEMAMRASGADVFGDLVELALGVI